MLKDLSMNIHSHLITFIKIIYILVKKINKMLPKNIQS